MNHYLDYEDDSDCFRWGGSINDLKTFINGLLNVDEDEDEGETKEDKMHKAITYKVKDCSVRFYTSTNVLMLHGKEHAALREMFHDVCERNRNPASRTTDSNGEAIETAQSDLVLSIDKDKTLFTDELNSKLDVDSSIPSSRISFENGEQTMPKIVCDHAAVMNELANLRAEIQDIKDKCFVKAPGRHEKESEQLSNDLLECRMEIKELKTQIKIQDEYTKRLEEEKSSLVTAIKLLMQDASPNTKTPTGDNNDNEAREHNPKKKKKKTKSSTAKENKNSEQNEVTNVDDSPKPKTSDERKKTIIIGDSIISKLKGWKMSDKSNRISTISISGSRVEDMKDYIKPTLKAKPDNMIVHIGTNNLRSEEPQVVAEKIVNICEQIERNSPDTTIAVSELTARQDSSELEHKRVAVNKILRSFSKSRNWKIISHDNIDPSCLNGRKLHLNAHGTINLAKNFKNYLTNLY